MAADVAGERNGLKKQPSRLAEAIFENLSEGVTIADCSLPDMPLIYVNRAFETLTGYSSDDVIGRNCRFLHRGEKDQPALEKVRASLKDGTSCTVVVKNYRKDGTLFYNELHLSPIHDPNGKVAYFIGIQRNVSERIYAEEALWRLNDDLVQANKHLNEANQRLNELLYVTAHDLKSPLTSIILSLEMLQQKPGRLSAGTQKRHIKQLLMVGKHMREIVVEMLDARRVESQEVQLTLEPINVALKARAVLRFYRDQARAKNISMSLKESPRTPKARADRSSVLVVLDNLVSNALKYSSRGGSIHVRVLQRGNFVRTEVEDTGPGITPDEMPKLFGRFVKLSAEPTGGEHSTGLGLYIVKKYVEMMKGKVWVESKRGKGACFIVELPLSKHRTSRKSRIDTVAL